MNVTYFNVTYANNLTSGPSTSGPGMTGLKLDSTAQVIVNTLSIGSICVIMMSLGCEVELKELLKHLRRPVGIAIGMLCQFILLPAFTFGLAHAAQLSRWDAVGMMILGTSPGGAFSNVATYVMNGDIPLSISMTTMSTAMGMGMMPLNLWLYSRSWTDQKAVIPYVNIVITLASILLPVPVGMLIRRKAPRTAKWIVRIGDWVGFLLGMCLIALSSVRNPHFFHSDWKLWLCGAIYPIGGILLGYLVALLCRRSHVVCRTIAIEITCQNATLAIALIVISFPRDTVLLLTNFSVMYVLICLTYLFFFIVVFRLWKNASKHPPRATQIGCDLDEKSEEAKPINTTEEKNCL